MRWQQYDNDDDDNDNDNENKTTTTMTTNSPNDDDNKNEIYGDDDSDKRSLWQKNEESTQGGGFAPGATAKQSTEEANDTRRQPRVKDCVSFKLI